MSEKNFYACELTNDMGSAKIVNSYETDGDTYPEAMGEAVGVAVHHHDVTFLL